MTTKERLLKTWLLPLMTLALIMGILLGVNLTSPIFPFSAAGLALLSALLHRGLLRRGCVLALMLAIGASLGWIGNHPALPAEGEYQVSAVVADAVQQDDGTNRIHTTLRHLSLNGKRQLSGAYWSFYADDLPEGLAPGMHVSFTAQLYHPSAAENPGGYDFRAALGQKHVTVGLYGGQETLVCDADVHCVLGMFAALRHTLSGGLVRMMGAEAGAYASAMLLGERTLMPDEDEQTFRRMGIAHILSISGYHVGILSALLIGLLRLLRVPVRRRTLPVGLVLGAYCMLTGLHPPVIRASLLVLLGLYGRRIGATPVRLHWVSAAALAQLLVSPMQLFGASFQLTYGALLGIIITTSRFQFFLHRLGRRKQNHPLLNVFIVAIGAQLGILLPELYWFHTLPLLGVFTNFVLLGVVSTLMGMYWLCLPMMLIPGISTALGTVAAWATAAFSSAVRFLSGVLGISVWTRQANIFTALGWLLVLCCLQPMRRRLERKHLLGALLGVSVFVLSVIPWPMQGTSYIQLSAGEADAAVLQDDGTVVVVDAGENSTLAAYLHARHMSVDTLILTHLHSDHTGGLDALINDDIPIRRCLIPYGAETLAIDESVLTQLDVLRSRGTVIEAASRGDVLTLPHGQLTVLWPEAGRVRPHQDPNDYSMTLLARLYDTTLLLTGDLTSRYELYAAVPADVLKAAHHGSATSTSEAFLAAVSPTLVLQSCGTQARVDGLQARLNGLPLYPTYIHGAITLNIDEAGYTLIPYRSERKP